MPSIKARDLFRTAADGPFEAIAEFDLGLVYHRQPLRDLRAAMEHYETSLNLYNRCDRLGLGCCLSQMAQVAIDVADEMRGRGAADKERQLLRDTAMTSSLQALQLLPANAPQDRAVVFQRLGNLHRTRGEAEKSFTAFVQAMRCYDASGAPQGQADARFNAALALREMDRIEDALTYAQWAEQRFARLGPASAERRARAAAFVQQFAAEES
jgi:tetratricopeptide (TPR) repeat protein